MSIRRVGTLIIVGVWLVARPAAAVAQSMGDLDAHTTGRALSGGGEISAILGPIDTNAFFNYTDYESNALRIGRIRLFGEWHIARDRLSLVGELRSENAEMITTPALYGRWRPFRSQEFFLQAGRIPPVIGAFPRRAYGRDNAVIGMPLAYQYLTSLRADALPATVDDLLRMRGRGWQPSYPIGSSEPAPGISVLSVSHWDTGVEGLWSGSHLDVAGALTRGSPAIPVVRETNTGLMWSGRVATRLPAGITVGVSAARGQWLTSDVLALMPHGSDTPSSQSLVGTDFELGLGPWLIRSEWIHSVFETPIVNAPDPNARLQAWSGFVEGRYQPFPRWYIGLRPERLSFSEVTGTLRGGVPTPWDAPVDRVEAALGFRASRHLDLRAGWQQNWRSAGRVHKRGFPAVAALYWF